MSTPERLQQSDIMAVVLANKPAIIKCVNEQKKKDPALSGKLVMRWTIQTSGKTTAVSCRTDEFRSTYMASCISGLIKGWAFPKPQEAGRSHRLPVHLLRQRESMCVTGVTCDVTPVFVWTVRFCER